MSSCLSFDLKRSNGNLSRWTFQASLWRRRISSSSPSKTMPGRGARARRPKRRSKANKKRPSENVNPDETFYVVEKIVGKRVNEKGIVEYFIKWKDYEHGQNTWEPAGDGLLCKDLIEEYEAGCKAAEVIEVSPSPIQPQTEKPPFENFVEMSIPIKKEEDNEDEIIGFDRGLEPVEIIGAMKNEDEILFLIRWDGVDALDLVSSTEANEKCPQLVITFYESRIQF